MALQTSKTCKIWIPLNQSVFSSGCLMIPDDISLLFFFFLSFWILTKFSQGFLLCCWMPFTIGCFPFYSVILGFLRYHWFPPFALLCIRTNVVLATLVAGPFLIFHYFLLLRFPLQKSLLTFLFLGCPRGLTFGLSSFKASRFHIFRPTFWIFSPLSFFPSEPIPSYQVKRFPTTFPYGSSSWVL